jgi:hypothetical protein
MSRTFRALKPATDLILQWFALIEHGHGHDHVHDGDGCNGFGEDIRLFLVLGNSTGVCIVVQVTSVRLVLL